MAGRIRTIKPELLEDEKMSALSDSAWRLFVASFLLADDHGRFRAGPRYLAAAVWQDTGRVALAESARSELAAAGRIRVYQVGSDTYAEIPTWARHQRIDNAGRPRVPVPVNSDYDTLAPFSRRAAAGCGNSREVAALPPTSDLRPPTPTPTGKQLALATVEAPAASPVERVWGFYLERLGMVLPKKAPRLNDKRRQQIKARIAAYGQDRVLAAVAGFLSPVSWNVTANDGKWSTPEYIFDKDERIEKHEHGPGRENRRAGMPPPQGSDDVLGEMKRIEELHKRAAT